jgi:alkylhydroperoxidase family enzyme
MGHCEMLLAVAGLDKNAIADRTQRLASGDWSSFTPPQRAAFAFARKQAETPAAINAADVAELLRHFGTVRSLNVIWWACRCHYMTRVADAFQLPLERDNVFMGLVPPKQAHAPKKR